MTNHPEDHVGNETEFGAIDIVEAFTALRNELKSQVRTGRDLQQKIADKLDQWSNRWEEIANRPPSHGLADEGEKRAFIEGITEIEESLDRSVNLLREQLEHFQLSLSEHQQQFESQIGQAPWIVRRFAGSFLKNLQTLVSSPQNPALAVDQTLLRLAQGLGILLDRVRRVMSELEVERFDTVGIEFDPQWMNAIDVVPNSQIASGRVAEQIRPGYRWRNKPFRFAHVRVSQ